MSLGEDIVAARKFLGCVHSQVANLLESLDTVMASHGLNPRSRNVSSGIGPQLNSDHWLVNYLYRFYSPNIAARVVGVVIYFDSWDEYGIKEPMCLAFAASFSTPQKDDYYEDSTPVLAALRDKQSISPVADKDHRTFFPNATSLLGCVIPLCELHTEHDLRTRIVDPLLEALRKEAAARMNQLIGSWPGDETDEEIDKALEELS